MGLSRKRGKELKRLRHTATDLWDEQREVLDHASEVVREAGRQLGAVSREEVAPRIRTAVDERIVPAVETGYLATKSAVDGTRYKIMHDVLPSVSGAIASALATLEVSKDPRVRDVVEQVQKTTKRVSKDAEHAYAKASKQVAKAHKKVGKRVGFMAPPKKSMGPGGYILIVLGLIAVAGVAYAAWQTLRADDELWVLDEADDDTEPPK